MHIFPGSRPPAADRNRASGNKFLRRPRGDIRFILPPIGLLFCAFAFLVYSLVVSEIRSSKVLMETEATRIVSVLLEGFHAAPPGQFEPTDARVFSFGLYKHSDERVFGFGSPPERFDASPSEERFTYDDRSRTLILVRPLFPEGRNPGRDMKWDPERTRFKPEDRRSQDFLYLVLDAREYYRTRELLGVAAVLAPILVLALGAMFILLILKNIKYRTVAEKRETLAFLGESARTLVHEIRNPLGAIRLQVGVLRRKFPADEVPEIGAIEEETRRLDVLVRRITEFLKNPEGSPVRVDLAEFLDEFSARNAAEIAFEPGGEAAPVSFDPDLLRSVLENLVRNALESYPEDAPERKVTLSLGVRNGAATVTVGDRGKGIQEAFRSRIFDPFFTDKPQGSGIGLPLARRFVEAAGGRLSLRSRKGGGTEARITLPLAEEP